MSTTSLARLLDRAPAGVYTLASDVTRKRVSDLCKARNLYFYFADCHGVTGKDALLQTLARDLHLPEHFGANWDALADCLMDMDKVRTDGLVIMLFGLEEFARQQPEEYATLSAILTDATVYWAEEPASFYVLLGGDARVLGPELTKVTAQ